jgi:hypothetical protein
MAEPSSSSASEFKAPGSVECFVPAEYCKSQGRIVYKADKICKLCKMEQHIDKLKVFAGGNPTSEQLCENLRELRKVERKAKADAASTLHPCAFDDPDFAHCKWQTPELNLRRVRGATGRCKRVSIKGNTCESCWGNGKRDWNAFAKVHEFFSSIGNIGQLRADVREEALRTKPKRGREEEQVQGDSGESEEEGKGKQRRLE